MPAKLNQHQKCFFSSAALLLAGLLIYFGANAGGERTSNSHRLPSIPSPQKEKRSHYIFEKLPTGKGILISETYDPRRTSGNVPSGDLWLQEADGQKRLVANVVVRAGFSPDGRKLAYITTDHELHIETIDGKPLARLQRIHDHNWSSDSATIVVSAMVSVDYPELQQTVVYNLDSRHMSPLSEGK